MPYDMSIPGQVSEYQLKAIELVASLVPENGQVVEIGSLFGCSSWAWAKSVHPSVTVNCIDPWAGNKGVRSMEDALGITYGLEQFLEHTKDCTNIVPCQGFSPKDFQDWSKPVDLYYEDAVHVDPIVSENLEFWSSRINKEGIICGDDYRPRFPDVCNGVQRLADKFKRELIRVDFFWCLLCPDSTHPKYTEVRDQLRALSAECELASQSVSPQLRLSPDTAVSKYDSGMSPEVQFTILNVSSINCPVDKSELFLSIRCIPAESEEGVQPPVLSEHRQALNLDCLSPDIAMKSKVDFSQLNLSAGSYRFIYDICTASDEYILHKNIVAGRGTRVDVLEATIAESVIDTAA